MQNGEEEDEEVGWDAGFIQANGGPVTWWRLEIDGFVVFIFIFYFF